MANRARQIAKLQEKAAALSDEFDELWVEMSESFDNMPENLQDGERGEIMQSRIDRIEEVRDVLTDFAEEEL